MRSTKKVSVTVKIDPELNDWLMEMVKKKKRFYNRTHAVQFCIAYTKEHLKED